MPTWTQVFQDTFQRANGAVGNGWTASGNGTASIANNRLSLAGGTISGSNVTLGITQASSPGRDQRLVTTMYGTNNGNTGGTGWKAAVQFRSNGLSLGTFTGYYANLNTASSRLDFTTVTAGTPTIFAPTNLATLNSAHDFQVDVGCYGVNPTTFSYTVTDLTTSTVMGTGTVTEATSTQTTSTGLCGLVAYVNNTTDTFGTTTIYAGALGTTSFYCTPSTLPTSTTISLSAAWSGGTAPYTGTLLRSTDNVNYTAIDTIASQTGTTFAFTDTGLSPNTQYYYQLQIADSTSPTAQTLVAFCAVQTAPSTLQLLWVGDSITANLSEIQTGFSTALVSMSPLRTVVHTNAGVAGTTSSNWANNVSNCLSNAISAANTAGCTVCMLMLGTNDSHIGPTTAAAYAANIQSVCTQLFAGIPTLKQIILNEPPTPVYVNTITNAVPLVQAAISLIPAYGAILDTLVNGTTILHGDRQVNGFAQATIGDPGYWFDYFHPQGGACANAIGVMQCAAFMHATGLLGPVSGGGGSGGGGSASLRLGL
jgi:lysophospholipase L1-like esterase